MNFLAKLFDTNERDVTRYRKVVEKINALEPQFQKLTDEELKAKTTEFKERVEKFLETQGGREALLAKEKAAFKNTAESKVFRIAIDKALDAILPEAFAACREASRRVLNMRHFDVQLIGGMVQHDGRIAELRTGEGKTLMCTLGAYLNALAGMGGHVVTANDYLVKRDAVWMGALFHSLGLTVGILQGSSPETGEGGGTFIYDPTYEDPSVDGLDARFKYSRQTFNRREAYDCDITYGTSSEFGFDYLRDNMAPSLDHIVQDRGHHFAIVDECDSNLIDEARTPLIISGPAERSSELYQVFDRLIPALDRGEQKKDKYDVETDEKDYTVDEKAKSASLTEKGFERIQKALRAAGYVPAQNPDYEIADDREAMQYATSALKAHAVFTKDKDYVVRPNQEGKPEVVIVDEFTGRLMFGRRWSDGLHQAVESKEGIKIENESQTLATITIQNYFRLYRKLAGMTGTAKTEEDEFRKIYALDVVQVPTNRPMVRKDLADSIYKTEEAKLRGIVRELIVLYCKQQPVLVGTRSIDMSERVSSRLTFQALETIAAVDLLRAKLEEKRKALGAEYKGLSDLLNTKLEALNIAKLAPVARAVGQSLKMLDKPVLEEYGTLLGVPKEHFDRLEEAIQHGIPHNILNAKYHEAEARIIAEAGRRGSITIATNMAGRGVDILLGGTQYKELNENAGAVLDQSYRRGGKRPANSVGHVVDKKDALGDPEELGPAGAGTISLDADPAELLRERESVKNLGGMYILGTERHESRRIDNQLRGRSGRQGDPGTSRFHLSLEDYLWRVFGDRQNTMLMKGWEEDQAVDMPFLSKLIERAQKKVEQHNFDSRKHVLEYDDVHNVQREVIYRERRKILEGADLRETITSYLHETVDSSMALYCPESVPEEEWDRTGLFEHLNQQFPLSHFTNIEELSGLKRSELVDALHDAADDTYEAKEAEIIEQTGDPESMRQLERHIAIREIDQAWVHHLADMDYLREGIGLRGYAQVDPLVAYKKEALEIFERMQGGIQGAIARGVFMAQIQMEREEPNLYDLMRQMEAAGFVANSDDSEFDEAEEIPGAVRSAPVIDVGQGALLAAAMAAQQAKPATAVETVDKVGPNDPCPCGSGKKYKKCHRNKPL